VFRAVRQTEHVSGEHTFSDNHLTSVKDVRFWFSYGHSSLQNHILKISQRRSIVSRITEHSAFAGLYSPMAYPLLRLSGYNFPKLGKIFLHIAKQWPTGDAAERGRPGLPWFAILCLRSTCKNTAEILSAKRSPRLEFGT